MKKLVVAGISLAAVGLLVLGSQTNVIGYQTVHATQQTAMNDSIKQKDLLFQTASSCGCEPERNLTWHFPILCTLLYLVYFYCNLGFRSYIWYHIVPPHWMVNLMNAVLVIAQKHHCRWASG